MTFWNSLCRKKILGKYTAQFFAIWTLAASDGYQIISHAKINICLKPFSI
jgi:hypothetical protein